MARNTALLATTGLAVGVGGYLGAGAFVVEIPSIDVGTGPRGDGTFSFSFGLTKTGGGNIDPAVEKLTLERSSDGVNFADLYADSTDSAPVNFLAGQSGASCKRSFDIRAKAGQRFRMRLVGDGAADAWTIDFAQIDF